MGGQAPRRVRLEHVVLQDEVTRVGPVVRDLVGVVVPHHVRRRGSRAEPADSRVRVAAAVSLDAADGIDEAVHLAVVDVQHGEAMPVRPTVVPVARIVERPAAPLRLEVVETGGRDPIPHRDPVGVGIRAEVGVERPVLLHDDDDVPDLVDADEGRCAGGGARRFRARVAREQGEGRNGGHEYCGRESDGPEHPRPAGARGSAERRIPAVRPIGRS